MKKAKMFNVVVILIAIVFSFLISGCFHDDEDKSVNVNIINGTWYGVEQDVNNLNASGRNKIVFTILGGIITAIAKENQSSMMIEDQGLVGTVTAVNANIFSYKLGDVTNTLGSLYVDNTRSHYTFLDDKFLFGVMQKSATLVDYSTIMFVGADVQNNWSGFSVNVRNVTIAAINNTPSQMTFDPMAFTFSGTDGANSVTGGSFDITGSFNLIDATNGVYTANWVNPNDNMITGNVTLILSPDKTFVAARFCLPFTGVPDIELCTFSSWNK